MALEGKMTSAAPKLRDLSIPPPTTKINNGVRKITKRWTLLAPVLRECADDLAGQVRVAIVRLKTNNDVVAADEMHDDELIWPRGQTDTGELIITSRLLMASSRARNL